MDEPRLTDPSIIKLVAITVLAPNRELTTGAGIRIGGVIKANWL